MKLLRTLLFCWLSLGLCASGWAFSPGGCAAAGDTGSEVAAQEGHDHHGNATGHSGADHHSGLEGNLSEQGDLSAPCECCDTCATACAFGVTAMSAEYESMSWHIDRHRSRTSHAGLRNDLQSYPPFRPPISTS